MGHRSYWKCHTTTLCSLFIHQGETKVTQNDAQNEEELEEQNKSANEKKLQLSDYIMLTAKLMEKGKSLEGD